MPVAQQLLAQLAKDWDADDEESASESASESANIRSSSSCSACWMYLDPGLRVRLRVRCDAHVTLSQATRVIEEVQAEPP